MPLTIQKRKQLLVRDAIWDAAIDLFGKKGFDKTTVDDIAKAAGVSRRSFFRYFSSKDDLLAQGMISYGEWLEQAIESCPRSWRLAAFARRSKGRSGNDFKPRLLALLTLSIIKAAVSVWSKSERRDMRAVIRRALPALVQSLS
jgi:AcrR family transcriptional regulator